MRAIDTNVLVRFLTGDDPQQAALAKTIVTTGDVFVCSTVLLETEWVLRRARGFSSADIAESFRRLAGFHTVTVDAPERIRRALEWMEQGVDFADALHLAQAGACEAFVTFDQRLVKAAKRIDSVKVELI
ncbi:MAG: type II toxin-antitoxin system VapC family toxin [Pseudomonadota bacterium]